MKRITHFIFDFDGTIADTESIFAEFDCALLNNVLQRKNITEKLSIPDVRALAGNNDTSKLEIIAKRFDFEAENQKDTFVKERAIKRETLFIDNPVTLGKNIKELIQLLNGQCAIATNKSGKRLQSDLKTMNLENLIKTIITCDPPFKKKPAPDMLLEASAQLNAAPENCAYIGDNTLDIEAAINANMTPIGFIIEGIKNTPKQEKALKNAGAHIIIDDFMDLKPYLTDHDLAR